MSVRCVQYARVRRVAEYELAKTLRVHGRHPSKHLTNSVMQEVAKFNS